MWQGEKGNHEYLVNVIWPLTSFTRENGATQIYPGSHGPKGMAREETGEPIIAECGPGSAICFLGSQTHGAGGPRSHHVRHGILIAYSLGWCHPHDHQLIRSPPKGRRPFSTATFSTH